MSCCIGAQAYDRKKPGTPHSGASADVLVLKELYPEVDDSTLNNVYNAAGQNVDVTKKVCRRTLMLTMHPSTAACYGQHFNTLMPPFFLSHAAHS